MPERAYVDANVILRFLLGDPPDMAARARALFERMERGEITLIVDTVVIAECVWTLRSFYKIAISDIATTMRDFLLLPNLEVPERAVLLEALVTYERNGVDFVDALSAARMHAAEEEYVYSFDRHFDRLPSVRRVQP
ncbi:MAG: PIN domain-containing protein [Anaerolineae bacterium]|jgi:predicted nucleic acid-binding protein